MKKILMLLLSTIFISIVMSVIFIKASDKVLSFDEAMEIGEEKYLQFLWMVDGAFNNNRLKEEFIVNERKMEEEDKIFTCKYKESKSLECVGNNFESEFEKLFSHNIKYEKVYSDEAIYSWISFKDGKYFFNNLNSCSINRMGNEHKLKVVEIMSDKIVYEVSFLNRRNNILNKRDFVLILENGKWKISSAFYYDLCGMWYTIY